MTRIRLISILTVAVLIALTFGAHPLMEALP